MRKTTLFVLLALLSSLAVAEDIIVVTSRDASIDTLSRADVQQLFSGKRNEVNGIRLLPLDLAPNSPVRADFYEKVLDKSPAQMRSHWARMTFTGKAAPPRTVSSPAELSALLGGAGAPHVGYVPAGQLGKGMKVLYRVE